MITSIVDALIDASTDLLASLPLVMEAVVELVYANDALTTLGTFIVATAGFALAWAGIRFVFGFITRLLNKSRAGA